MLCLRLTASILAIFFLVSQTIDAKPSDEYGTVEILRDKWGIPHIFSDTDEGAMYGLGYACAEDRAFQMYYSLRIIQGRLAEVVGDRPKLNRQKGTAVDEDKKMRIMGFYRGAKRVAQNLDKETMSLLQAYSDGVNDFIRDNPEKLLYLFGELGLEPEPWTPADCIASWWHVGKFFAAEGLHDTMVYHRLKSGAVPRGARGRGGRGARALRGRSVQPEVEIDEEASVVRREDVSDEWLKKVRRFEKEHGLTKKTETPSDGDGPRFSHAWLVGGKKTSTGSSVLCSDPQTLVRNPSLFYEFHISGETFNARGIGVPGSPVLLIGFTEHVAWGLTALGADQADQFFLKTDPEHPDQYYFDGEWRDMRAWTETIKVKDGSPVKLTLRETHLGPVVNDIAHDVRRDETVVLKRIPMCETDRETCQGAFAMIRSNNVAEFSEVLEGWRFPSANIVFGDTRGDIAYWTLAAIPIRSRHALDEGKATHDGSASKYDWQGIVPYDLLPHVVNPSRGYLESANHRPIGPYYTIPIGISTGSGGDTVRSWRLRELLKEKERFTPKDVLAIHYDCVNAAKREIVRFGHHLRDVLKKELPDNTMNALEYLEDWYEKGAESCMDRRGSELVNLIPTMFRMTTSELTWTYGGGDSGLCRFLKEVSERLSEDPKASLNEQEQEYIASVLAQAWEAAVRRYGRNPKDWHDRAQEELSQKKMGYFVSLDGFPSLDTKYDLTFPELTCTDHGTILSQEAQSYSQWVPMHDVDSAMTILPIGQTEHPGDEYRTVNYDSWATGKLHPAPLSREKVEMYVVGHHLLSK